LRIRKKGAQWVHRGYENPDGASFGLTKPVNKIGAASAEAGKNKPEKAMGRKRRWGKGRDRRP